MPKISVIIPVFNMEKYVCECLDSVLGQTLKDIEVIAVNDGSTDSSLQLLKEYQSKDNRIKIINKENAGVGAARNDGIRAAVGEYLAFMDPDDLYASQDVLLHCYETAEREGVSVVGGRTLFLYKDGTTKEEPEKKVGNITVSAKELTEYKNYQYDYGYVCFIYKRSLIVDNGIFFPPYTRFQDPPFFVRAMIAAQRFYALDEAVYMYRQLPGVSKLTAAKTLDFLQGLLDNLRISKENGLAQLHYICAERLNTEGSYMILHNSEDPSIKKILSYAIKVAAEVDTEWLKNEGFITSEHFLPEVFAYMIATTAKYEKARKNRILRGLLWGYLRWSNRRKK